MSEEFAVSPFEESLSWSETWIRALTSPSVETYAEIASDPNAGQRRAYTWIIVSSLIGYILSFIVGGALGTGVFGAYGEDMGSLFIAFSCGILIVIFASVFGIMINAGISQLIASLLGGTGTYDKLLYGFAAYSAPLALITYILSSIPFVNCLAVPLGLYAIILNVTAIKAVHQFSWGRAVASSVAILALLLALAGCVAVVVLGLLGPTIETLFTDILR